MAAILDVAQGYLDYLLGQEAHNTSFGSGSTAHDVAAKYHSSIRGRTFMVTGATSGMGREVAFVLASHGAVVILLSRNAEKLQVTQGQLQRAHPEAQVHTITCDLSSSAAVQAAIAAYKALNLTQGLHALICNAGIAFTWNELAPDPEHNWHKHKVESQFATNYLGHFALTLGLMPYLIDGGRHGVKSRIVLVSSLLHRAAYFNDGIRLNDLAGQDWYEPVEAYGQSKLALLLFMEQLDRRLKDKHWPVTVNAMHPGMVNSSITRHFIGNFLTGPSYRIFADLAGKSVPQGANTHIYLAVAPLEIKDESGKYYVDTLPEKWGHHALKKHPKLGEKLWAASVKMTGMDM